MGLIRIWNNKERILGLNERYLEYIRPYNTSKAIKIADDKILTKEILSSVEIPVPPLIDIVKSHRELEDFDFETLPSSFVIKPVRGIEGGGIEIFYNKKNGHWIKSNGDKVSIEGIRSRVEDILDGRYSLHNQPDQAMFEERVKPHKAFRYYTYKGTPDVRIVVFNKIPIMSYVRLPTKESFGRANLAQGAIGAAIDIAAGRVTTSIIGKKGEIEYVPNTSIRLSGLRIPYWSKILEYAIRAHDVSGLGFAAVDFLIDRDKGPMIVELNARPGLSIQLANQAGLAWRLNTAKGLKVTSIQKGIRMGKDLFGGEIEETVENITGKQVIGIIENITLYGKDKQKEELKAKIDTGADSTSIDRSLLEKLGYKSDLDEYYAFIQKELKGLDINTLSRREVETLAKELTEKAINEGINIEKVGEVFSSHGTSLRPYFKVDIQLSGVRYSTLCSAYDRSKLTYRVIVGRKSLGLFLIEPSKI